MRLISSTQKYFAGTRGRPKRIFAKAAYNRVVNTITTYGFQNGYFDDKKESKAFSEELKYILASQRASFNSPVWFNIGAEVENSRLAPALYWV